MHHRWVRVVWIVAAAGGLARTGEAGEKPPVSTLTQLVGRDAGLCVEVHRLAVHRRVIAGSEFFLRVRRSVLFRQLARLRPFRRALSVREQLEQLAGKPLSRLLDELFGQQVVLAVYPRSGRAPGGILLTRAKNPQVLQEALAIWNRAEPQQISRPKTYRGVRYVRRQSRPSAEGKSPVLYYVILKDVFALSDREEMIQKTIELWQASRSDSPSESALPALPQYRAAKQSLRGDPLVTVFLNPRRWDFPQAAEEEVPADSAETEADLPARLWKAAQWLMAGIRWENGPLLEATVAWDPPQLPKAFPTALARLSGPPDFLGHVPADVLMVWAGRWDPQGVARLLKKTLSQTDNTDWHRLRHVARALLQGVDVVDDIFPRLKPNGGFYLIGKETAGNSADDVPLEGLLALEWSATGSFSAGSPAKNPAKEGKQSAEAGNTGRLEEGFSNALHFLATLYNINRPPGARLAVVKHLRKEGVSMYWIDSLAGWKPAVALTPRYLLLAGSPQRIADFQSGPMSSRLVQQPAFRRLQQRLFPDDHQLVYIDTARLRDFLQQNGRALARRLAGSRPQKQAEWERKLNALREGLDWVDVVFFAARVEKARLRLTAGMLAFPSQAR